MCVCVNTHLVAMRRETAFYNLWKKPQALGGAVIITTLSVSVYVLSGYYSSFP